MEASTTASINRNSNDPIDGEFPENSKVGVLAYCLTKDGASGTSEWTTKQHACIPFMPDLSANPTELRGVELTKEMDGSWTYGNGTLQKWYENDEGYLYSFFAYTPYDDTYFSISTINRTEIGGKVEFAGAPVATFHLPFNDNNPATTLNRTLLRDAMLSNNIDFQSTKGNVSFKFYHMTSGLRFAVNNYDSEHAVTIKSLTLSGTFNKQMTIKAQTDYEVAGSYAGTFTIADAPLTVAKQELGTFFKVGGATDAAKVTLLLIPNIDKSQNQPIIGIPGGATPQLNLVYQIEGSAEQNGIMNIQVTSLLNNI